MDCHRAAHCNGAFHRGDATDPVLGGRGCARSPKPSTSRDQRAIQGIHACALVHAHAGRHEGPHHVHLSGADCAAPGTVLRHYLELAPSTLVTWTPVAQPHLPLMPKANLLRGATSAAVPRRHHGGRKCLSQRARASTCFIASAGGLTHYFPRVSWPRWSNLHSRPPFRGFLASLVQPTPELDRRRL